MTGALAPGSARLGGRLLLVLGGALVLLGSLWPEAATLFSNLLGADPPVRPPDRSHWVVFRESLDMLTDPDPSLDDWYYDFYAAEVAGLAWLAASGVVLAASGLFARSRAVASGFALLHAASFLGLAVLGGIVSLGAPEDAGDPDGLARKILLASVLLAALLAAEVLVAARALRRGRRGRLLVVDAVNVVPIASLLALNAGLYAALAGHPNWPAGGYAVAALGSLLALAGLWFRRERVTPSAVAAPGERSVNAGPA